MSCVQELSVSDNEPESVSDPASELSNHVMSVILTQLLNLSRNS